MSSLNDRAHVKHVTDRCASYLRSIGFYTFPQLSNIAQWPFGPLVFSVFLQGYRATGFFSRKIFVIRELRKNLQAVPPSNGTNATGPSD